MGDDAGETRRMEPLEGSIPWSDTLDDTGHVYVNSTIPVGVEVSGGDAHLKAGKTDGWLASEVITCPPGHRYDLVLLEVDTPGRSHVNISVLNASSPPMTTGFANGTIEGYEQVQGTELSLNRIDAVHFPRIRIQVDLHAVETYRPRLLAWSVLFVDIGEWREDFLGTAKMSYHRYLNLTGEGVRIEHDPSSASGGVGYYEPYPTLAWGSVNEGLMIMYPNSNNTGYDDLVDMGVDDAYSTAFGDLDQDGYMDLVVGAYDTPTSRILWGDRTETFSLNRATTIAVDTVDEPLLGDFNGDGWTDILFVRYGVLQYSPCLYLNHGYGVFNDTPEIVFPNRANVLGDTADFNGDIYDDIMMSCGNGAWVWYGGPDGPDTTVDITFGILEGNGATAADLDQDGYTDVVQFGYNGVDSKVYMGGPFGIDTTEDYLLAEPPGLTGVFAGACGDMNDDGYLEIAIGYVGVGNARLRIFKGSASGWSASDCHDIVTQDYPYPTIDDLDKDGYEDLLIYHRPTGAPVVDIFRGGDTLPTNFDLRKSGKGDPYFAVSTAIPRITRGGSILRASFTTEDIHLPEGMRWDIIDLLGTVPLNTSIKLTILNETGDTISGTMTQHNVDLSSMIPSHERTIRVRVTLTCESNDTTPTLERLLVKWCDKMTWRDEFYGDAKVERLFDLGILNGSLQTDIIRGTAPQLVFANLQDDMTYNPMSYAYSPTQGLDYDVLPPMGFQTTGAMAAAVADVNADGHLDVAFASYVTSHYEFATASPLFLGTPVGWMDLPHRSFNTTGARDVLLEDLNGDGLMDIVFAQEQDGMTFAVDSLLFWGKEDGWAEKPDVRLKTRGASGVAAADLDGDDDLDLAFACYSDGTSTDTDSMVFLQDDGDFDGASPDHRLPTQGARAVAAGDLDGDLLPDLVFANSRSGDDWEIDSYAYLAKEGGGFDITPVGIHTEGAQDVKVDDLDLDGDLDLVFANMRDDQGDYTGPSYVYLNDGSGGFPEVPSHNLNTEGAMAVEVVDLDGVGWKDLVFAFHTNGTSYELRSRGYLGRNSEWWMLPQVYVPTMGASDVVAAHLFDPGDCGYMSQSITPIDIDSAGGFHTLRYTTTLGGSTTATLHVYDAVTWEPLASTPMVAGTHEWDMRGRVYMKAHGAIRVVVSVEGLESEGDFSLDDLWLNWTERVEAPPTVLDVGLSRASALRLSEVVMTVNLTDEYDTPEEVLVTVEHRRVGDLYWDRGMAEDLECVDGVWTGILDLGSWVEVGAYQFRVTALDLDGMQTIFEAPVTLEVLNNVPTAPEISLTPETPLTGDTLEVTITRSARDVEDTGITYRFQWYRHGTKMETLTSDQVAPEHTLLGQNWSVEVRAFDGDDEGPPAKAWVVIGNSPVTATGPVDDIVIPEDGSDDSLYLTRIFSDPDGGLLAYTFTTSSNHVSVAIAEVTGRVTLTPDPDWWGNVDVTFNASDGETWAEQTVFVQVEPVNDIPTFQEVNGEAPTGEVLELTVRHGEELVVTFSWYDVEGDEVRASVDRDDVTLEVAIGELRYSPSPEYVGTFTFNLTIWDTVTPREKVTQGFSVTVVNVNDPPGPARITHPADGATFKANETFTLRGACDDPDILFGQELTFSWTSNFSGLLGYGTALDISLWDTGTHTIRLLVSDGELESEAEIEVVIVPLEEEPPDEPPPNGGDGGDGGDGGTNPLVWVAAAIVMIMVVVGTLFIMMRERVPEEAPEKEAGEEGPP